MFEALERCCNPRDNEMFESHKLKCSVPFDKFFAELQTQWMIINSTYLQPSDVRHICGMAQYTSRFIPDLAGTLEPIRPLTRKNAPFVWSVECANVFDILKKNLSESACLAYYDPSKELLIQVDSSQHGVGAVLLQDGRPIEYASRALTHQNETGFR